MPWDGIKRVIVRKAYLVASKWILYPSKLMFDRVRGVDFFKKDLEDISEEHYYEATHLRIARQLKRLCQEVTSDDSIIDLGCGKGRMLAFFHKYPFDKVDGVEIDKRMADIGNQNINKLGINSKIYNMDARYFCRWDDYNYFYFYNPFPKDVIESCATGIVKSAGEKPRKITVFYANPTCHQVFIDHGFKEVTFKLRLFEKVWHPYLSGLKVYRY